MSRKRRHGPAWLFVVALFVFLAAPAPALPKGSATADGPEDSVKELMEQAEQLKSRAKEKEVEAEGATEREHFPDAYDRYRETISLVRQRGDTLKLAARKVEAAKTLEEINKAYRENEQWKSNVKELIDLLKLSQ